MNRNLRPSSGGIRFELSFNWFNRIVMTPILAGPRRCDVVLSANHLRVRMGLGAWAFAVRVPRSSITGGSRASGPVLGWGAHGWRGRWLINGSSRGLVRVSIDPPKRGRCVIFPIKVKELMLSLDEPDAFLAALGVEGGSGD